MGATYARRVRWAGVGRGRRGVTVGMAAALVVSLGVAPAQAAPGRPVGPAPLASDRAVPGRDAVARAPRPLAIDRRVLHRAPAVTWPVPAAAEVGMSAVSAATRAGSLPVWVGPARRAAAGSTASALAALPGRVRVQVLGRAAAGRAGVAGVLLRVGRSDGRPGPGRVSLRVDYSGFRDAFGGDWGSRLTLVSLPGCALSTPSRPSCRGTVLPGSSNEVAAGRVTADVAVGPAAGLFAVTAAASGSAGDYTATSLSASASWQVAAQTGDFSWSYPLRVPPAPGGLAPALALSYNSGDVDGRVTSTNNQPSWVGEGWSLWPGYVERKYRACADDGVTGGVGDLCWGPDNATLVFGGRATELVRDDATGGWRPRDDDGSTVEHLTGAVNGTNGGERWRVTTTDGTQYYFGQNQLPGWVAGNPVTNSAWTVPVFGNNAGEPCPTSCAQPWRWNLDYVVDPHGNSLSYYYTPETNFYDKSRAGSGTAYVRGGVLAKVVYGTRATANYATPPAQVVFGAADRCVTAPCTLTNNATTPNPNWPDLPADQYCSSATCTNKFAPTFFTQKKLTTITSQVWTGTGTTYNNVDSWTLNQSFTSPGDGTSAALWLAGITHTGQATGPAVTGAAIGLPAVTFGGGSAPNRVNPRTGYAALNKSRLTTIRTETGGQLDVNYTGTDCNPAALPAADQNTHRCFPVWWTPPGASLQLDWFTKYVVNQVVQSDLVGGGPAVESDYDYVGPAAWHYADSDETTPAAKRTWSSWRGYAEVHLRGGHGNDGPQTLTVNRYYRGMDGDKLTTGTRVATVTDSEDRVHPDSPGLSGFTLEQQTFNGVGGAEVSGTISDPVRDATATHAHDGLTVSAYSVHTATEHGRTDLDGGRPPRRTQTDYTYDDHANITRVDDHGDLATTDDDRCTRTSYAANSGQRMFAYPTEIAVVGVACAATPTYPDDAIADTRSYYDTSTTLGALPRTGDVTRTDTATGYTGATATFATTAEATFDSYGRQLTAADALHRTTTTAYTDTAGLTAQTVVTDPAGYAVTSTIEPSWGQPTAKVDANGMRTDVAYDALGRVTGVWLPGRKKAQGYTPNTGYAYLIRATGANAVTTTTLGPNSRSTSAYTLYDGLLRTRQTQAPAEGGTGRVVTDTFYDSRGLAVDVNAPYWNNTAGPGTTLLATDTNTVPGQTVTNYDGAGRPTAAVFASYGAEKWRTTTAYRGDHVDVTPAAGGTATTSYTDARGQTTRLLQYHADTPGGQADTTTYAYTNSGHLAAITDPAGNHWAYGYDLLGHRTSTTDPDTGTSTSRYDLAGQLLASTDARGATLAYTYDALGRKTGEYDGSTAGTQLAGWTYDTLLKGYLTAATRYVGGQAYINAYQGYTGTAQPYGQNITVPAREGALAGTYRYDYIYNPDHSLQLIDLPITPGLPNESLTYSADDLGHQTGLDDGLPSGIYSYVTAAAYTQLGQPARLTLNHNGGVTTFLSWYYDLPTQRLTRSLVELGGNPVPAADTSYGYDPTGNITDTTATTQGGTPDTQCFSYDYLRRLTQAWTPNTSTCPTTPAAGTLGGPAPYWQTYTYDLTGNRTSDTRHDPAGPAGDLIRTYAYPAPAQPQPHTLSSTTTSGPGGPTTDTYGYDAAGNTTTRAPAGQPAQTLGYDTEGHLASLTTSTGASSYVYDADGTRLIRHDPDGATLYLPQGVEVHADTGGTTTSTRRYSCAGTVFAVRTTTGLSYLATDPHATATVAINAATGAVSAHRVDPFGNPRDATTLPDTRGFVGGIPEPATGLTRLGARDYDAALGRFITVDPLIDPADPQQLNGYTYADDNPTTNTDPAGLAPCTNGPDGMCHLPNGTNIPTPGVSDAQGQVPSSGGGKGGGPAGQANTASSSLGGDDAPVYTPAQRKALVQVALHCHCDPRIGLRQRIIDEMPYAVLCEGKPVTCLSELKFVDRAGPYIAALITLFMAFVAPLGIEDLPAAVSAARAAEAARAATGTRAAEAAVSAAERRHSTMRPRRQSSITSLRQSTTSIRLCGSSVVGRRLCGNSSRGWRDSHPSRARSRSKSLLAGRR